PNKRVRDLLELLDPIGTVQWVFMETDLNTRKPTGRAFVEMWSDTEAELVVNNWNKQRLDNNTLSARMASESTPEVAADKAPILNSPPDFIYSVIRFQVNAPTTALVLINDIPKAIADESGTAVIRALLPGNYEVKVIYKGVVLIAETLVVNCDEAPPTLTANPNNPITQSAMPNITQSINVDNTVAPSGSLPTVSGGLLFTTSGSTTVKSGSRIWFWAILLLLFVSVGGVIAVKNIKNPPPEPPPPPTAPEGMVLVPAGKVVIGRVNSDDDYEKPAFEVRLADPYFMDKYEVTNESYWLFVKATSRTPPSHWGGKEPPPEILRLPVTHVSWSDANAYCQWKGTREGIICRLPSEYEWEHAARGQDNLLYTWGNQWREGFANINRKDGEIANVGSYTTDSSPFGVVDMNGNVREWTRDSMQIYPNSKAEYKPGVKMVRGGAFSDPYGQSTNTYRNFLPPDSRFASVGFRCMCDVPSK
ncbi:MAG: SUMF1/EgtB/PvdO family nonheme iron enzyme, partial [Acidobacteriota bacterium]